MRPHFLRTRRPCWVWRAAGLVALAAATWLPAHAMNLTDVHGKHHTLEVHRGKWVLLNVWATWCAPCIKEMPELQALAAARSDVVVLGLAADGANVGRLRKYAQALNVSYPIIAGNAQLMDEFKVKAYPTTFLYDPQGKLVLTHLGQVTRADIEPHLPAQANK